LMAEIDDGGPIIIDGWDRWRTDGIWLHDAWECRVWKIPFFLGFLLLPPLIFDLILNTHTPRSLLAPRSSLRQETQEDTRYAYKPNQTSTFWSNWYEVRSTWLDERRMMTEHSALRINYYVGQLFFHWHVPNMRESRAWVKIQF
jgi:hypothetical protein